jgi:hypothetical protein
MPSRLLPFLLLCEMRVRIFGAQLEFEAGLLIPFPSGMKKERRRIVLIVLR